MRTSLFAVLLAGLAGTSVAAEMKVEKLGEDLWRVRAKRDGTFRPEMVDFPTVRDGREGVRFIQACLRSNAE